jgi:hypothetical protein
MKPTKETRLPIRCLEKPGLRLTSRNKQRVCNICAELFKPRTVFDRYCPNCKTGSEMLKFSEWLPEMSPSVQEKLSA